MSDEAEVDEAADKMLAECGDAGVALRMAGQRVQQACNAVERTHWLLVQGALRARESRDAE